MPTYAVMIQDTFAHNRHYGKGLTRQALKKHLIDKFEVDAGKGPFRAALKKLLSEGTLVHVGDK